MLISLELTNFKKHEELSVDFTGGTNGIYGPNYKGKTTLLYAILFALGGSSHVPGTRLERRGSNGRYRVLLRFSVEGVNYSVERTKSTANLHKGAELIATSASAVTSEIEKLIGMSVKQWKELHYAKQKNAHSLLRYSATNLHQLMRRLVGAEELDQVQGRLKLMAQRAQGVVQGLSGVEGDPAELQDEVSRLKAKKVELELELEGEEDALRKAEAAAGLASSAVTQQTEVLNNARQGQTRDEGYRRVQAAAEASLNTAKQSLAKREADNATAVGTLEAYGSYDPTEAEAHCVALEQATQQVNKAATEAAVRKEGKEGAATAHVESAAATAAAEQALADCLGGRTLEELRQDVTDLTAEQIAVKARYDAITSSLKGAACPTCLRPMEGHDPVALAAEQAELKTELGSLTATLKTCNDAVSTAARLKNAALISAAATLRAAEQETAVAELSELADTVLAESNKKLAEVESVGFEGSVEDVRRKVAEFKTAKATLARTQVELLAAQAAVTEAEVAQAATPPVSKTSEGWEAEVSAAAAQLNEVRATLQAANVLVTSTRDRSMTGNSQLNAVAQRLASKEVELANLRAAAAKLEAAAKRLAKIHHLQKYLKEHAERYMNTAWSSFMAHASQFANLCTGGDVEGLSRTEGGDFSFVEDGEEMTLEEASGAQEAIIGLAVQLALASAAPCHLNVLLLDEPTADMDPDRSMATIAALSMLGQQIVFVSHHQSDNVVCNNAIML